MGRASGQKTAVLTVRIAPLVKMAAEKAAAKDHRSVTNFIEVLVLEHCRRNGIPITAAGHSRGKK